MDDIFARDPDGRLILHAYKGKVEYESRMYNHRAWVNFTNGQAMSYGVIWRTRRKRTPIEQEFIPSSLWIRPLPVRSGEGGHP
jgi:hypothetical protein